MKMTAGVMKKTKKRSPNVGVYLEISSNSVPSAGADVVKIATLK